MKKVMIICGMIVLVICLVFFALTMVCRKKEEVKKYAEKVPAISSYSKKDLQVPSIVMELIEDEEGQSDLLADMTSMFKETSDPTMWQMVMLAQFHKTARQQKKALNFYLQAAEKYPLAGEPLIGIGNIYYDAAIKHMILNNEFEQAETGLVIMRPGDKAKDILVYAKSCFEKANGLTLSVREEKNGIQIYLFGPEKAEEFLNMINSKLMGYWIGKGCEAEKAEQYEFALKCFEEAFAIDSDSFAANYGKGNTLFMLSRFKDAFESFEKALSIRPKLFEVLNNREITKLRIYEISWPVGEGTVEFLKKETRSDNREDRLGGFLLLYLAFLEGDSDAKTAVEVIMDENPKLFYEFKELKMPKF